jgi:hypothetical protein
MILIHSTSLWGILFFAPVYFDTLSFALFYFEPHFLRQITLALYDLPLLTRPYRTKTNVPLCLVLPHVREQLAGGAVTQPTPIISPT